MVFRFSGSINNRSFRILCGHRNTVVYFTMATISSVRSLLAGITCIILSACLAPMLIAQVPTVRGLEPGDPLPFDANVKVGRLKNGLTYYIRKNGKPEGRAELRLVINVGSVLERPDQQGLAHFLEHMAFNGTRNFRKHELVNFLESIGMRFGADLNAHTSFDETVYMLQLPTGDPKILDKGFQILEDWAHGISLEDEEIDKERGVVREEWRLRRGADARMRDAQFPVLLHNSPYADRLPIGSMAVIDTFHYETLREFYRTWYRPDLMAVIAVGDFDEAMAEKMIQTRFNTIPVPQNPSGRTTTPIPDHDSTLFAIASDPEATRSSLAIYYKHPYDVTRTVADYRRNIVEGLYDAMFSQRLYEISRQPDAPFLFAYSGNSSFSAAKDLYILGAGVANNGVERGLEAMLVEAERVRRHGFTLSELERSKQELLRNVEQLYQERDKTESGRYADEYAAHFLEEAPAPGIGYELELYQMYLPGITLEEINALADQRITDHNRVVYVNTPAADDIRPVTEASLRAVLAGVRGTEVAPYVDQVTDLPLLQDLPTPGTVVAEHPIAELGVVEWKLSNGVRVVLKPTDFKNDEVLLSAFSPGGTSLASDADYISATSAAALMGEGGLGDFDRVTLEKLLAGKVAQVAPYIGELQEGLSAQASPRDLETMFQLIYLTFTAPRADSAAFISYRSRIQSVLQNRNAQPETAFNDTLQVTLSQYHPRRRPATAARYDALDLTVAHDFYRQRFADASDFTFVIVGNFTTDSIRTLVGRYLGGLPSQNRAETWRDIGVRPPTGVVKKDVYRGVEPKSTVQLVFTGPFEWTTENRHMLMTMTDLLEMRLREELREEKGGTYGVSASRAVQRYPAPQYSLSIMFGCAPERVDELINATVAVINQLKEKGPRPADLEKEQETQNREREIYQKDNRYWISVLQSRYINDEDPLTILSERTLTDSLTAGRVRSAAQKYFNMDNYVQVVLHPEKR